MLPDLDYPAAHSMDTGWFAVDRDGHVAYFYSGEAGAVPAEARREEPTATLHELESLFSRTEPVYELHGRSGVREEEGHHVSLFPDGSPPVLGDDPWPVLLFVTSLDAVREEFARGLAVPVPSRDAAAVFFRDLPIGSYRRLHESGACLGCFENDPAYHDLPERLGLYHYDHPDDLYIPEPYGRLGSPRRPLRVDQLPADLGEALTRATFDGIRFEESGRIQPIEHAPCECKYVGGYVGLDGRMIRPIPGQEDVYREEHEQLAEDLGLPSEPPPGDSS
jgi:hypothetical protein